MSYVMPPNNAIAAIMDPNRPDEFRRVLVDMDQELQLRDYNNFPDGGGPVRGRSGGRARGRR